MADFTLDGFFAHFDGQYAQIMMVVTQSCDSGSSVEQVFT